MSSYGKGQHCSDPDNKYTDSHEVVKIDLAYIMQKTRKQICIALNRLIKEENKINV